MSNNFTFVLRRICALPPLQACSAAPQTTMSYYMDPVSSYQLHHPTDHLGIMVRPIINYTSNNYLSRAACSMRHMHGVCFIILMKGYIKISLQTIQIVHKLKYIGIYLQVKNKIFCSYECKRIHNPVSTN